MGRHSRDGDSGDLAAVGDIADASAASDASDVRQDDNFRALIELSPDAIYVVVDGYHAFANARGLQLLGTSTLDELRARPALDYMHYSAREDAEVRYHAMVDRNQPVEYAEEKVVRLDGAVVDIEASGRPISFGGKRAALLVARDITSRRQAQDQLRAAEEKFRAAFKYAPTGMAIVDDTGAFVETNPALARLLGRRPGSLLGAALWDYVDPEDLEHLHEEFLRLVEGVDHELAATFRYRNGAGADGWMRVSVAPLAGTDTFILHLLDVTAQKQTEADLSRKATHDLLTGLPNRGLVLSRLGAALRSLRAEPGEVHVLFVDLNGFKQVNDKHGHAVGDRVLRAAAERMKAALRPADTIGRIGGDEFVVIIKSLPMETPAEEIAHRLAQAVAAPVALDEGTVSVRASIGHASIDDADYPAARLLGSADADMYRKKQSVARHSPEGDPDGRTGTHPGLRVVPRSSAS
jgi:diguanylate cyclase (GGDEF)-like protein/PAS domain S-box-containing protein